MIDYEKINNLYELDDQEQLKIEISNMASNDPEKESIINQLLIFYTYKSDIGFMDYLVGQGANLNVVEKKHVKIGEKEHEMSSDLLGIAIFNNDIPTVDYLLDNGADINAINNSISHLNLAISKKYFTLFEHLIERGACLHISGQPSLLNIAVAEKQVGLVNLLLDKGFNFDFERERHTDPLLFVLSMKDNNALPDWTGYIAEKIMKSGYTFRLSPILGSFPVEAFSISNKLPLEMYEKIITKMAKEININYPVLEGLPAIHSLVQSGNFDFVEVLLKNGMEVDKRVENSDYRFLQGFTPLMLAAHVGKSDIADLLLKYKADPNFRDINGDTPLNAALMTNRDVFVSLLSHGADLNTKLEKEKGEYIRPIHFLCQHDDPDLLNDVLNKGLDANQIMLSKNPMINEYSPIMLAAVLGYQKNIDVLIKHGGDINYQTSKGMSAVAEVLLSDVDYSKALFAVSSNIEVIQEFIDQESIVSDQKKENADDVEARKKKNKLAFVDYLVSKGANLDIKIQGTHLIKLLEDEEKEYVKTKLYPKKSFLFKLMNK